MDGVQLTQGYSHFEEAVYFLPSSSQFCTWYSFYQPRKDERLSRPWSHPVVLNTGPLDWESSALTTRPHHKNMTIHTFSSLYAYKGFMKFHWNLKIKRKGHHTEVI